jgi:hypothetical protein
LNKEHIPVHPDISSSGIPTNQQSTHFQQKKSPFAVAVQMKMLMVENSEV